MFYLFDKCSGMLPPVKEVVTQSLKSKITDEVILDVDSAYALAHMILDIKTDEDGMETYIIPPDIILANTLPIKHFSFKMKDVVTWYEYHINDTYAVYHFENVNKNDSYEPGDHTMICEEKPLSPSTIKDYFAMTDERTICVIGTVIVHQESADHPETAISLPLVVDNDNICYFNHEIVDIYMSGKSMKHIIPLDEHGGFDMKHAEDQVLGDSEDALMFFYTIECALLHPVIVEVFNNYSKKVPLNGSTKKFKKNKRANIRYIKQIRIGSMQPIDEAFKKRGFIRKTMVWYVTGHWREYKSGKRIFIQGYWKGMLRDSKTSETRDRSIVFIDENTHVEDEE